MSFNCVTQKKWIEALDKLKAKHDEIANEIGNAKVAFLDLPIYFNVGDLLIYKGTESFIVKNKINVVYRFGTGNYFCDKNISKSDVILLSGGGNFGDIYKKHQKLREKIISKYHDKKIIILPQTIKFLNDANFEKTRKIFRSHPNVIIYVRDETSYKVAKLLSDKVYLMPDMAHSLHPLKFSSEVNEIIGKDVNYKILNMVRTDGESSNNKINSNKESFDWGDIVSLTDHMLLPICDKLIKFPMTNRLGIKLFEKFSADLVFKSKNYFENHNIVYTDRLHGCILSVLLGKTIKLMDNSYGKNTNYVKSWLNEYPFFLDEEI